MNWVILSLLSISVTLVVADLPSCARARCVHCEVDFISRMCPAACASCAHQNQQPRIAQVGDVRPQQPPIIWHPTKNSGSVQKPVLSPVRQAGVQTQAYQQVPQQPYAHQAPAQAFAAPVQQYGAQASTLAPLIEQPNANQLNPQLATRPADLAHPLPEYQRAFSQNFNQPQQGQFNYQQPGQQQPFQQNFYQQQPQQPAQPQFPGYQQPQQSQFFNPFQPFLQNGFQGGSNPLDPLGLFNFGGQNTFTHAAPVAQVAPSARTYPGAPAAAASSAASAAGAAAGAQPHGPATAFNGNYNPQPSQTYQQAPQPAPQPAPQAQAAPLVQQPTQVQPSLQLPQMPSLFTPPHVPPSPPAPATIALQPQGGQYRTNAQTQPAQQPQPQVQQPQQPLPQQPAYQQPPQTQQPLPPISNSIDSAPSFYGNKYYGEKGPAPAPPPAQCPRAGWEPCISKDIANERFRNCCTRLGDGCSTLCNYDANLATMQLAVLTGRCPLNKVADMMVCASGYEDATPCCEAYNVFEPGYEQCRPYCNPAAGLPQGGPLSDKYKCLVKLGAIQQCFYVSQKP